MKQATDRGVISLPDKFTLCWCHRLFRGYGIWVFANLLFYVVFMMMVCKGTFPGGFRGMMGIVMQAMMISQGLLLGLSCCSAFALSGMWKRFFPEHGPAVHYLWYLSFPLPVLQVWGYLAICWRNLRDRGVWLALLVLGSAGVAVTAGCGFAAPVQARWGWLGWGAFFLGMVLLVQGRLFWVIAGMQYTRKCFRLLMSIAGLTVFSVFAPQFLMNQAAGRLRWVREQLELLGVPGDIVAVEKAYYQGTAPDRDWSRLAEILTASESANEAFDPQSAVWAEYSQDSPEAAAAARMLVMHNAFMLGKGGTESEISRYSETSSSVQWLNHLIDQKKLLRCRRDYSGESLSTMSFPDLKIGRSCAAFFAFRGRAAAREGDFALAEAYWRRCCAMADQLITLPDGMLSALGGGIAVERTALKLAKEMIVSGGLNAAGLEHWKKNLGLRREKYISWVVNAMKCEPVCMLDLARRGIPEIRQYHYRNWGGAPMFCYIQNDLFTGLNIQAYILRDILQPGWRPAGKNAYDGAGFRALDYLKGMTFTPMVLGNTVREFLDSGEELGSLADLVVICAEIENFRQKNQRLPESLKELPPGLPQDALGGSSYVYQLSPAKNGYMLRGVGGNRRDDGGKKGLDVIVTAADRPKI